MNLYNGKIQINLLSSPFISFHIVPVGYLSGKFPFLPLDEFINKPIIERNLNTAMNPVSVTLIIVVLLAVLIIKDQFVVRMAAVKVK